MSGCVSKVKMNVSDDELQWRRLLIGSLVVARIYTQQHSSSFVSNALEGAPELANVKLQAESSCDIGDTHCVSFKTLAPFASFRYYMASFDFNELVSVMLPKEKRVAG